MIYFIWGKPNFDLRSSQLSHIQQKHIMQFCHARLIHIIIVSSRQKHMLQFCHAKLIHVTIVSYSAEAHNVLLYGEEDLRSKS